MFLLPLPGQYEQIINGQYAQKLGLGISNTEIDEHNLGLFLDEAEKPIPQDERILWPDNEGFFQTLQKTLNQLHNPINITLPK